MSETEIDLAMDAAGTAATAAILVSKGRPEDVMILLDEYTGPVGPLVAALALLAGRGVKQGQGLDRVLGTLQREATRLQSRTRNLS